MPKQQTILLDLFSGIGGFAKGIADAGIKINHHYFSEIEKHAIANYKNNFKTPKYVGSIVNVSGRKLRDRHPNAQFIVTFGSPCQDFSLAGKRKGLTGHRSSLIMEAIRLISEIQPSFFIWENVKGTFSSNNGKDFWAILNAFTNIGGYRLEWQLLNTKWVLPQNRERIYLVGHFATPNRSFSPVFPFTENDKLFRIEGKPKQRQLQTQYCTTITEKIGARSESTFIQAPEIASTLTVGGKSGGLNSDMTTIKVHSATKKGFEVAKNGDSINLSNLSSETRRGRVGKKVAQTLETSCNQAVIIAQRARGKNNTQTTEKRKDGLTNTITSVAKDNYLQFDVSGKGHKTQQDRVYFEDGFMCTIPTSRTENKVNILTHNNNIRRLTEIECERLQGFIDNWTKYGMYLPKKIEKHLNRKKRFTNPDLWLHTYINALLNFKSTQKLEISATNRYKLIGNAVTADMVEIIATRLKENYGL